MAEKKQHTHTHVHIKGNLLKRNHACDIFNQHSTAQQKKSLQKKVMQTLLHTYMYSLLYKKKKKNNDKVIPTETTETTYDIKKNSFSEKIGDKFIIKKY